MKHEKIIKRANGSSVMISVSVYVDGMRQTGAHYSHGVCYREKGKRKWIFSNQSSKELATEEEIRQVKLELWEKLKP